MTAEEAYVKNIRDQSDTYERTIMSIIAFDAAVRWDDSTKKYVVNSHFLPGRRMMASKIEVTPDLVVQLSPSNGIIAESKLSASTENDFKNAHEQISKYDDDLEGWVTSKGQIGVHDISLLVDHIKKTQASDYFSKIAFKRKFSLISCVLVTMGNYYFSIEKVTGEFSDDRVNKKLRTVVAVPMDKIQHLFSVVKFYDARPPVEYTMNTLWMHAFTELVAHKDDNGFTPVTSKQATDILFKKYSFGQFDARQPKSPREAWIKEALELFVKLGYGFKDSKDPNIYLIDFSSSRRKESFAETIAKKHFRHLEKKSHSEPPAQAELPNLNA